MSVLFNLEEEVRHQEIRTWVENLVTSLGGVRSPVAPEALLKLYQDQNYSGMLQFIRESLRLDMRLRVGYVNSGGPANAPAWAMIPVPLPRYGTREFKSTLITVYFRKKFLSESEFSALVFAMAHELCHVVLYSIGHTLQHTEEAVDLTAMILGYREFYLKETTVRKVTILPSRPPTWLEKLLGHRPIPEIDIDYEIEILGYLTMEERRFAASLMS